MSKIKNHHVFIIVILAIVIFTASFTFHNYNENYSLADFGIPPLLKPDCSSVKDTTTNSPVTISFNAPNVSLIHDKINTLITKYSGHVTSNSFSSYPAPALPNTLSAPSQDSLNITVTFDKSQNEFLAELSSMVKSSGGVDASYSYSDGSQPQYGVGYSSYTSCITAMQLVSADVLQLEVLVKALKEEHNPGNISLLSQSISNVKNTLQTDVNSMNSFFATSDKPSVNISVSTSLFQK